mmetsp:Transcript_60930/g.160241  ORF Transcript_60930/g.160241 Transcript_60930/m.160241 type:complete len:274 (+) Transcript_60930:641-1462(+)
MPRLQVVGAEHGPTWLLVVNAWVRKPWLLLVAPQLCALRSYALSVWRSNQHWSHVEHRRRHTIDRCPEAGRLSRHWHLCIGPGKGLLWLFCVGAQLLTSWLLCVGARGSCDWLLVVAAIDRSLWLLGVCNRLYAHRFVAVSAFIRAAWLFRIFVGRRPDWCVPGPQERCAVRRVDGSLRRAARRLLAVYLGFPEPRIVSVCAQLCAHRLLYRSARSCEFGLVPVAKRILAPGLLGICIGQRLLGVLAVASQRVAPRFGGIHARHDNAWLVNVC